jgi:tetraacyldisaccharide 4'-kinase
MNELNKLDPEHHRLTGFQGLGLGAKPLSVIYGAFIRLRGVLYDLGILRVRSSPLFTISVGGLEVGGVGKTPVVAYLLRKLLKEGSHPALLSRGYGRETKDLVLRLPGDPVDPAKHGDEPAMVVASGLDIPLGICGDRSRAARVVAAGSRSDVLVMDDGFAHRRLARHLDLVVLRGEAPLGNRQLLPSGTLREPPVSLNRAHLLWFHSKSGEFNEDDIAAALRCAPGAGELRSVSGILSASSTRFENLKLAGKKVVAVVGIARPGDFIGSLKSLGADICELKIFPDHHRYTRRDRVTIGECMIKQNADYVVTTSKDYVKLQPFWGTGDLVQLIYGIKLVKGEKALAESLNKGGGAETGRITA